MMRELGIRLSSQKPIEHRERLIINTDGKDLPELPQTVNARILSISTGVTANARLLSTWNEIQFPRLEVLVLNSMSKIYSFPKVMQKLPKLRVLSITNNGYDFSEIQNFPATQCLSGLTRMTLDGVSIPSISTSILMLENLEKLSMIMCKIDNGFNEGIPNRLRSLLEIKFEYCDNLVTYPASLCNLGRLEKLCITNCHELTSLSGEFVNLPNLKVLNIASCSKLTALPDFLNLENLEILDLSHCERLYKLPMYISELGCLQTIDLRGCTGLPELPSVKDFGKVKVICDEETSPTSDFEDVKVEVVGEDPLGTFSGSS
ncbi:putative leucine-rich repeat domain superfamily [Helianthus anomalus]